MLLRQYAVSTSCLSLWQFASGLLHVSGGVTHNQCVNHGHLSTSTISSIFHYFCHWFSDVIFLSSATYAIKCFLSSAKISGQIIVRPVMICMVNAIISSRKWRETGYLPLRNWTLFLYNSISYCINTILF